MRPFIALLLGVWGAAALANPLFDEATPIDATLSGELDALMKNARTGGEQEFPFRLLIGGASIEVDVRARGKSRRKACNFPPLRLDIKKASADGTPFEGQNKLKLVTHCNKGDRYETFVLEEYAIYRMLNVLTPSSFRVRLLRIGYQQTGKDASDVHNAFVIEDDDALALRMGGKAVDPPRIDPRALDPEYTALAAVFQFMIANFDWSSVGAPPGETCCHNGKAIELGERYRVVPYDFDLAGLIATPYATPNPELGVRRVRDRVYRGFCASTEAGLLASTLALFREKKDALLGVHASIPGVPADEIEDQTRFVRDFFELIDDPKAVERQIVAKCR